MAGLVAVFCEKSNVHVEHKRCDNDSATNYIIEMLESMSHRGNGSMQYMIDGKYFAGPYKTFDLEKSGLSKIESRKGVGMMTKLEYNSLLKKDNSLFIDGYVRKPGKGIDRDIKSLSKFNKKFSEILRNGMYDDALDFANYSINGCLIEETNDGVVGLRTATGYKQLFLVEATDDKNHFYSLSSEDCVVNKFKNLDESKSPHEFQGMDVKTRLLDEGELVKIDKNGPISYKSKLSWGSQEKIEPEYDPHDPIYGMSLNSTWNGKSVHSLKKKIGADLFKLYEDEFKDADIISYVPDNATTIAFGFRDASGIELNETLLKDRYNRHHQQVNYEHILGHKMATSFLPIREMVSDKKVVLIDDSIISGSNLKRASEVTRGLGKISVVSAELPVISTEQVGMYSQEIENDLIANQILLSKSPQKISDFNREVSAWSSLDVHYNTGSGLETSLGIQLDRLAIPGAIKKMKL